MPDEDIKNHPKSSPESAATAERLLLRQVIIPLIKETSPSLSEKIKVSVYEPDETLESVNEIPLAWKNSPWGIGLAHIVYCQIHNGLPEGLYETRQELAVSTLQTLINRAESNGWSPIRLFAEAAKKFSVGNRTDDELGRVTPQNIYDGIIGFCGDSFSKRFSFMKAICALKEHAEPLEAQIAKIFKTNHSELPEEWNVLRMSIKIVAYKADVANAISARNIEPNENRLQYLEEEFRNSTQMHIDNTEKILRIFQIISEVYLYVAVRSGFTRKNAPLLMHTQRGDVPVDELINIYREKKLGHVTSADLYITPLATHHVLHLHIATFGLVFYLHQKGYCFFKDVIKWLVDSFAHELHHSKVARQHEQCYLNMLNVKYLNDCCLLAGFDNYYYTVLETSARSYARKAADNMIDELFEYLRVNNLFPL